MDQLLGPLESKIEMKTKIQEINKALVASVGAVITAALPQLLDAFNSWVTAIIAVGLTGAATWRIPNVTQEDAS